MAQMRLQKKRLMSIDPSINNLGVAIWDINPVSVVMHKLVHPKVASRINEYEKSWSMLEQLRMWKETYNVSRIICEVPEYFAVSGFEARETGSMAKLSFVCGLLYSMRDSVKEYKVVIPREWKGQLSKGVMCERLKEHYTPVGIDLMKIDSNVADAIGIGHFYLYGGV